jgi:hypothetical protein
LANSSVMAFRFLLILAGAGEASQSPAEVSAVAGILGLPQVQTRVIGDTVYTYRPQAAEIDGGRPWVRGHRSRIDRIPTQSKQ